MKVFIQSKTVQVTEALRSFIEKQASKLGKRGTRITAVTVFLEKIARKKNDLQAAIARIKVDIPGRDIVVENRSRDMYVAILGVVDAAARSVRKHKERRLTTKRLPRFVEPAFNLNV